MAVNSWIAANLVWITLAITILVLIYLVYVIIQSFKNKRAVGSQLSIILLILGLMFLIFLTYHADEIEGKDWGQIILMLGLVIVTALYASSTEKQAKASVKMAKEMREQRRPIVVQEVASAKSVPYALAAEDVTKNISSDYFEIRNVGNSTAIELEIIQLNPEKKLPQIQKQLFLLCGIESPVTFYPQALEKYAGLTCYLLCRYRSVLAPSERQIWYETWLPFVPIMSQRGDRIIIKPRELEFCEVFEKKSY